MDESASPPRKGCRCDVGTPVSEPAKRQVEDAYQKAVEGEERSLEQSQRYHENGSPDIDMDLEREKSNAFLVALKKKLFGASKTASMERLVKMYQRQFPPEDRSGEHWKEWYEGLTVFATKDHGEREDEEIERLVRPEPKKKPPRGDLRRQRIKPEDDPDIDHGDRGDDKDLSIG